MKSSRFPKQKNFDRRGRGKGAGGMEKEPIKSHEDLEVYKMAFDSIPMIEIHQWRYELGM